MNWMLSLAILLGTANHTALSPNKKYDPTTLVFPTRMHVPIRKATKFHLFLYVQNRVKVRNPQGIAMTRLTVWDDPKATKDDDEVTVYGVNSGQNVIIYNTSMTTIGVYGLNERGPAKLNAPHGITAAPNGDVYVADTGNNRLVRLFNPGRELRFQKEIRSDGFSQPFDVALAADGALYASDTGNNRVVRLRGDTLAAVLAGAGTLPGKVWQPRGIAVNASADRWNYWKEDLIAVVDLQGKRVQTFRPDGTFLRSRKAAEFGYPDADLQYVMIDYYSNIWISDKHNHCLHKFDRHLNYLDTFGRKGTGNKEFIQPRGVAIYKRFGQVLVVEKESVQYYWVGTDIKNVAAQVEEDGYLTLDYFLTERSFVTLDVLDERGDQVGQPLRKAVRGPGQVRERFSGDWRRLPTVTRNGRQVFDAQRSAGYPRGSGQRYTLRLKLSATYSSYKYFEKRIELKVRY